MRIRSFVDADLPALTDLTIDTFRPFEATRRAYGEELFALHHGHWEQEYRDELPGSHDPAIRRWVAVAEADGDVAGFVAWNSAGQPDHGWISLLAVAEPYRRGHVGTRLCGHALDAMKAARLRPLPPWRANASSGCGRGYPAIMPERCLPASRRR